MPDVFEGFKLTFGRLWVACVDSSVTFKGTTSRAAPGMVRLQLGPAGPDESGQLWRIQSSSVPIEEGNFEARRECEVRCEIYIISHGA
jgi:hypothetical protein